MSRFALRGTAALILVVPLTFFWTRRGPDAMTLPDPVVDTSSGSSATAVLAGGCFWGIEAVFEHIKGVTNAVSGYAGGSAETADYQRVSSGTTGHAEAVQITYDPAQVSYGTLLKVFFSVAHDPTQLNRQGPDIGTQYRSAIFYADEEQARVAKTYIEQLKSEKVFPRPIVTQVVALQKFYPAEEYHQDYMKHNPNQPYIVIHDRPKVEHLKKEFPELYRNN
jgi:peptide-methionine (S)-S-oxide reductase